MKIVMKNILLVDDSSWVRSCMRHTLEQMGHTCVEAGNGRDALQKLRGNAVSLVITDVFMPEMDGLELIRRIGRAPIGPKIIAMSGSNDPIYLKMATHLGACATLEKPFISERLFDLVHAHATLENVDQQDEATQEWAEELQEWALSVP